MEDNQIINQRNSTSHCFDSSLENEPFIMIDDTKDPFSLIGSEPEKILIIDDAKDNRTMLCELLMSQRKVILAKDGAQGLALATKHLPDLILLDVMMPGITGHQVIRSLKSDESTMHIPVIFISSKISADDEKYGLDLGAVDYISKPFHPAIVQARVKNVLREQRNKKLLEKLALVDSLTEIYNRRFYELDIRKVWNGCKRENKAISLALLDIDYFKSYNDEYGHLSGDEALRLVAKHIKNQLKRPHDIISRYGGEEFVIVLPDTNADDAKRILTDICQSIEQLKIPHESSVISHYVTISIGGATMIPKHEASHEELVKIVDEYLYQAKAQGRNRVCWQP
ncbi:diguanylate cyclase [Pseudoalteromonas tunicata]|uniref:GGDEF domain-containing response regulator n=1 Tax=Pseudoalteromonas tunicata TaxID=314281 RepID=UPI00273CFEDB|nr:diguanylate cyclase [Pseudoalteromonas tunicata]MDP5214670.1 diguanylate cyclase [Pseudoalteromonas tunicata]